ncbi:hypothetical protein Y032_0442g1537 [Ancylostoma ceylanicum]|uniref:EGF-like domain-containing protein n=1 Tax=Ancylostoma ceylanicum TaxID=53326 RepID=A0A016WZJ8_9BILA|nr:hypothetical protein Y032_0442g1537 [Ancylostoma ceylanicum]
MMFIFNGSDALYPSIYLGFNATSEQRFRYVQKIKTTIDQHEKCRKDRCNGHGKCVLEGNSTCPDSSNYAINTDEYKCECDKGFNGPRCSS